jgi:hypothetical protein
VIEACRGIGLRQPPHPVLRRTGDHDLVGDFLRGGFERALNLAGSKCFAHRRHPFQLDPVPPEKHRRHRQDIKRGEEDGLDIDDHSETALHDEWFAPVLGVCELPGEDPASFMRAAVDAANERLHGTLSANVVAHPRSIRALGRTFDDAIAELRYGTIAVNAWTGLGYLTPRATWGAFPGHPLTDIQSGRGVVHNALLLDGTERTVVRGPFHPRPKPPWFITNCTAAVTGRRLTEFRGPGPMERARRDLRVGAAGVTAYDGTDTMQALIVTRDITGVRAFA